MCHKMGNKKILLHQCLCIFEKIEITNDFKLF